jgi:hypothetical protein
VKLAVGAVSRRVVEEAAKLQVHQIVASRAQVNEAGGYIGLTQHELVEIVKGVSLGKTDVVRDHGGPLQGGRNDDDGVESLINDVNAGFDGLHLDVCKLPRADQPKTLRTLIKQFGPLVSYLEIGGEHDEQAWNDELYYHIAGTSWTDHIKYAVVSLGSYAWADKQYGEPLAPKKIKETVRELHASGFRTKLHNMDHIGDRTQKYGNIVDAYNLAPEIGMIEVDALLTVLSWEKAAQLLHLGYASGMWRRWFNEYEGTLSEKSKCGIRYIQQTPECLELTQLTDEQEYYVRSVIRDAIVRG